jgi:hypothetical protein
MKRSTVKFVSLLAVLLLCSVWLFGQAESGQIGGTVTDASNAVVPGAKVTVTNVNTGLVRNGVTNNAGEYVVSSLRIGTYDVTIEKEGFQKYTTRVQVDVASKVDLSAKLAVTGASTTVEVTASGETAVVNTETQTISTVVTSNQLADMPTLTRNPYDLVATSGNVSDGDSGQAGRGVGYAINGQRSAGTSILLDGAENVDLFTASVGQSVPLDSVAEFRISTSNFTAEYGRASGGVVNVTTKSGTNQFHGTLFEFNRVAALASNTYDNNAFRAAAFADGTCTQGQPCAIGEKPGFTRNQFGYSIGGPILKNKLFFFSATEWTRVRSNATINQVIVDPAFLSEPGIGAATLQYFNAFGQHLRPGIQVLNHIPFGASKSALLPANAPFMETVQYQVPSNSGAGAPQNTYSNVDRVDWNISDKTQLYGRYALYSEDDLPGFVNNSPYAGYDTGQTFFNQNVTINLTHVFTTNLVNSFKVVYNRLNNFQPLAGLPPAPTLYTGASSVIHVGGNPVGFPGYTNLTPGNGIPFGGPQNLYQIYDDLSWSKGKHQLKFGGAYIQTRDNRTFGAYENPVEAFSPSGSGSLGATATGLVTGTIALFQSAIYPQGEFPCFRNLTTGALIQTPQCTLSLPVGSPAFNRNNVYNDGSWYVNDSWKVTQRLTLNLGLRWEYYGVQHDGPNPNLDSNFYFGPGTSYQQTIRTGTIQIADKSPVGGLWAKNLNNWAPRVGFAWDVLGNGTLSFRGGYGISYERNFGNVTFNVIQNPPNYGVISINSPQDIPVQPIYTSTAGPLQGSGVSKPFPGVSCRCVDPHIKQAYANFWSGAIDYQLLKNTVLSVEYVGSHGVHLYSIANINKPYFGSVYLDDSRLSNRLNQQYTTMNFRGSGGFNQYNGINVKVQSNNLFNKGLYFNANYTWSHAIDDNSSTFGEGGNSAGQLGYTDPFNPSLDKGNSEYDIRQRFVFSGTWNLPWGNNSSGWVKQVVGGWSFSPIYTIRTGSPFTIYDCTNSISNCPRWTTTARAPVTGNAGLRAISADNFLYMALPIDPNIDLPVGSGDALEVPGKYLPAYDNAFCGGAAVLGGSNYSCSGVAPIARNSWQGPINWTFNAVVAKNFKLTERFNLQFRFEMYNMFNHSNYYVTTANADVSSFSVITAQKGVVPVAGVPNEHRDIQFGLKLNF